MGINILMGGDQHAALIFLISGQVPFQSKRSPHCSWAMRATCSLFTGDYMAAKFGLTAVAGGTDLSFIPPLGG